MKPDDTGTTAGGQGMAGTAIPAPPPVARPFMEDRVKQLLATVKEAAPSGPPGTNAGQLLTEMGQCLDAVLNLIRTTIANIRPTSEHTLPAVASTLTSMIHASETVAHRVLDEADGLTSDHQRLLEALARVGHFVSASDLSGSVALVEAREASNAIPVRITAITSAMEFQDIMAQHLTSATKAIEGIQLRLAEILTVLKLPLETVTLPPIRLETRIVGPTGSGPWRQVLTDQHFAEGKESGRAEPRP